MNAAIPYSNQYLLSTQEITLSIKGWQSIVLTNANLHHAPNLAVFQDEKDGRKITLLGFAIHVLHPEWDEQVIVEQFPAEEGAILDYLDMLCGIHLVIVEHDNETKLYNDAAGVMKMFAYTQDGTVQFVASDPKLISEATPLEKDNNKEALEFYSSDFFTKNCIRLGDLTQFQHIKQVLPNHSISLQSGTFDRYFPRKSKMEISVSDALNNVHTYFTNVLNTANRKYDLKCSMTAGWDSRMVLAMTKGLHQHIDYYTFWLPSFNEKHEDVKIPKGIAKELNLKHEFIPKDIQLSKDELTNLQNSFSMMEYENINTYLGGFPKYIGENNALLVGTVSEICKNYYDNVQITDGVSFAKAAHFPIIPYSIAYFGKKLEELQQLENEYGYDLRDIAHWEQDITNFAAKRTQYLYSFVRTFSPFNARIILQTILSIPREMRDKQQHEFYRLYLEQFYPELLKFPVNPSLKQKLIRLGKKVGIYGAYKKLSTQLRK